MKKFNPLQAIQDMAENKKINFFTYMAIGGFEILPRDTKEKINKDDIIFSLVMTEDQYNNFLASVIVVFEIAELSSIIGQMSNEGHIKAVKMDLLEENEYGVTFIKRINDQIESEIYGVENPNLGNRILK